MFQFRFFTALSDTAYVRCRRTTFKKILPNLKASITCFLQLFRLLREQTHFWSLRTLPSDEICRDLTAGWDAGYFRVSWYLSLRVQLLVGSGSLINSKFPVRLWLNMISDHPRLLGIGYFKKIFLEDRSLIRLQPCCLDTNWHSLCIQMVLQQIYHVAEVLVTFLDSWFEQNVFGLAC